MYNNNSNLAKVDIYKNIIEMRKECEKLTCAPFPKDPDQPLPIQELSLK
jgi:hypothetical protein